MRALRGWFGAVAFFGVSAASAFAADTCTVAPGGRVVLAADAAEPDVFLWDSRTRLVDYVAGRWDSTRAIFAHTELAEAGTQALVVMCVAGIAHPKVGNGDEDAVGVKVLSGRHRGRYAWVLSSDVHRTKPGNAASAANASKE
jgi:hypothetical protein